MSTALDSFERSLVSAGEALGLEAGSASNPGAGDAHTQVPRRRRPGPLRRLRSLGLAAQVAAAIASLSVCTGAAVAAYGLLAGGPARLLPEFECQISGDADASIPAVTGSPILDCAGQWAQATGGLETAPPLAIWGANDGQRLVAVAAPASAGPPSGGSRFHWQRLPDGWTVELAPVILNDQLSNIGEPFANLPGSSCSEVSADVAGVQTLLRADGLASSWRVALRANNGQTQGGCQMVTPLVEGQSQTVELLPDAPAPASSSTTFGASTTSTAPTGTSTTSAPPTAPANIPTAPGPATGATSRTRLLTRQAILAQRQLDQLYTSVNATLAAGCESVPAAAALWTQAADAAGYSPTTLGFWRQANTEPLDPATFFKHYTLYQQPSSQHTGSCAHVLVMVVPGSGLANVYVARIPL